MTRPKGSFWQPPGVIIVPHRLWNLGRMRIVYLLTSLGMGGAERLVLDLASRIAKRGHTVSILVLRPQIAEQWPTALPVVHLGMRRTPISVIGAFALANRFLGGFHPDLVHSHGFHSNIVARLLKLFNRPRVVLSTVHNVYEGGWQRMWAYRLTDGLSRQTTAVSRAAAERFVQLKAVPKRKCTVLTNGIDTTEFAPEAGRRARVRAEMGVDQTGGNEDFIWLTAGRIVPAKDIPNLLRAFAVVRSTHPEAQLWIAGEWVGTKEKRGNGFVSGFVVEHGSLNGVRFLGLRRDLPGLLDAADGFVLASAWEGMPLALGEAMSMEKPVVATDVGGVLELVGDAGMIVPAKDSNALAAAMLSIMQLPAEERRTLGSAARDRIRNEFSMDTRADDWEALYVALLQQRA
jgi:glycosyltransferase involved in cell wall biosynthesis